MLGPSSLGLANVDVIIYKFLPLCSIYSKLKIYIKGNKLLALRVYTEFISVSITSEKTAAGVN